MTMQHVTPETANGWVKEGTAILIDVREPSEYAREHIIGARLVPLSGFDKADFASEDTKRVVFYCQSGARTAANAERLLATADFRSVHMLDGGLAGWKKAGLPVHLDRRAPIDVMRQVQIVAGGLIVIGVLLALAVSLWFLLVPVIVGGGLMFAGATGWCGMARMLLFMPWNRETAASS